LRGVVSHALCSRLKGRAVPNCPTAPGIEPEFSDLIDLENGEMWQLRRVHGLRLASCRCCDLAREGVANVL
jgi:hypothetical protein